MQGSEARRPPVSALSEPSPTTNPRASLRGPLDPQEHPTDSDDVAARPDHRKPVQPPWQPQEVRPALGTTTSTLGEPLEPKDDSIP